MLNNETYKIAPLELPSEKLIYLDIETEPFGGRIWLIGIQIDGQFSQLYADDWGQEEEILEKFLDTIRGKPGHTLVSYSGTNFDLRNLEAATGRPGFSPILSRFPHVDLCSRLRRCFIFPNQSYGLKDLGTFLGYPFRNPDLNGLEVALLYQNHVEKGVPLDPKVFEYNEDDVKALPYLIERSMLNPTVNEEERDD